MDISNVLNSIGSVASILGLALTVYVFFTVRNLKRHYVFAARVPDIIKKLSRHASTLLEYHGEFDQSADGIRIELGRAEVGLQSLSDKLEREGKRSIRKLQAMIGGYKTSARPASNELLDIYTELTKVIDEVRYRREDMKWER